MKPTNPYLRTGLILLIAVAITAGVIWYSKKQAAGQPDPYAVPEEGAP